MKMRTILHFTETEIIAIDACTPLSKKINCLVLEDFD